MCNSTQILLHLNKFIIKTKKGPGGVKTSGLFVVIQLHSQHLAPGSRADAAVGLQAVSRLVFSDTGIGHRAEISVNACPAQVVTIAAQDRLQRLYMVALGSLFEDFELHLHHLPGL